MLKFISDHKIHPVMDQMFPLEQYSEAFKRLEEARQLGKIGFTISE
jgi:zinc-binding alcohol dehydrogenase/oxidoreductase